MRITKAPAEEIHEAMRRVGGNLCFSRFDTDGKGYQITLRVKNSSGRFARRSQSGRRMVSACYHGHYRFMIELFKLAPMARVKSAMADYDTVKDFLFLAPEVGDRNIGSLVNPVSFEDACGCGDDELIWADDLEPLHEIARRLTA